MRGIGSISQLMAFAKIVETGSLSKAARELNLTPSAVSKSLSQLEERLGVLLVKRTTRSLSLTDQGYAFFEHARVLLEEIERAIEETNRFRTRIEGTLRITSSIAFGLSQLQPLIGRYMEAHPHVTIILSLDDRFVNLAEEQYDIAVRVTAARDWGYAARNLGPIRWVYCASPRYLEKHGEPVRPGDLAGHRCLAYPAMTPNGVWSFRKDDQVEEIKVDPIMICNSSSAILQAVLSGQGIACLPTYIASRSIVERKVSLVLPQYRAAISHTLYAMYFKSKYANPVIRSFLDFVAKEIGDKPPWDAEIGIW